MNGLAFSADGKRLVSGGAGGTAVVWEVLRSARRRESLEALWRALGAADAERAHKAVVALAAAPDRSVPYLARRLCPTVPPGAAQVTRWIAELDADAFEAREAAEEGLVLRGREAVPALRQALKGKVGLEQRLRVERILRQAPDSPPADELLAERAVAALEHSGSRDALRVLEQWAKGPAAAPLAQRARAAVERVRRRAR